MKLSDIKQAVIAAFAQQHQISVTTTAELKQAAKQLWPEQTYNFRTAQTWLNFAESLGVDIEDYTPTTQKHDHKLTDIKTEVCQHYEASTTKQLKVKLKDWGISHGKLSTRQAWEELLEGCKASRRGQVIALPEDPLGVAA